MAGLLTERGGSGDPLVLLHGLGMSIAAWDPVAGALSAERDLLRLDLPGFGGSAPLAPGTEPAPHVLARAVAAQLDAEGLEQPHLAGHSLGGWVALELAKLGRARSVTAIAPAGFWNAPERAWSRVTLRATRAATTHLGGALEAACATPAGRIAALGQMYGRPWKLPAEVAVAQARTTAAAVSFEPTLVAMTRRRFTVGEAIRVPVTVAWGTRDALLFPWQARRAAVELPQARMVRLHGCGHVPFWDDTEAVTRVLLEGSRG